MHNLLVNMQNTIMNPKNLPMNLYPLINRWNLHGHCWLGQGPREPHNEPLDFKDVDTFKPHSTQLPLGVFFCVMRND